MGLIDMYDKEQLYCNCDKAGDDEGTQYGTSRTCLLQTNRTTARSRHMFLLMSSWKVLRAKIHDVLRRRPLALLLEQWRVQL